MKNTFLKQRIVELEIERDSLKEINSIMFEKLRTSRKVFLISIFAFVATLLLVAVS